MHLESQQRKTKDKSDAKEIQSKIETYQKEMKKIKSIFPENFFENNL